MPLQLLLREQLPNRLGGVLVDTVELTGLTPPISGAVTFRLYGPDVPDCSGTPAYTSPPVVSGTTTVTSPPFVPTQPGRYQWTTEYLGDGGSPHLLPVCGEANESVDIRAGDPRYGVNSKSRWTGLAVVSQSWFNDVANLGVGRVRLDIRWDPSDGLYADCDATVATVDAGLAPFITAIQQYLERDIRPLIVLGGGILNMRLSTSPQFNPLGSGTCLLNFPLPPAPPPVVPPVSMNYITAFAARAAYIAKQLYAEGARDFQIWNEPNAPLSPDGVTPNPEYIPVEDVAVFANLVSTAAKAIRDTPGINPSEVHIVTGGISFVDASVISGSAQTYVLETMEAMRDHAFAPQWNAIGIQPYVDVLDPLGDPLSPSPIGTLLDNLRTALDTLDPPIAEKTIWITEFGTQRVCEQGPPGIFSCIPSEEDQTSLHAKSLRAWYAAINARLLTTANPIVGAAFWFSHERLPDPQFATQVAGNYGLTNTLGGVINPDQDHWEAWKSLRFLMDNA
ncbi:MAG: hypothetical protein ACKVVP_03310 [Chloroflexota bacterium]